MPIVNSQGKVLGILKPVGGGDPIALTKAEVTLGRRRSCDISLDFNNISGKHCQLRLINSVWHVRDLGSTNGTSLNGIALTSEHSVMPDDELGIASHLFTIDYEPGGPDSVLHKHDLDETAEETPTHRHSLLELAGIDTDDERPRHRPRPSQPTPPPSGPRRPTRPRGEAHLMAILNSQGKVLGILKPVGGGDPIALTKAELTIGRRRSCDISLDFNNISGKHCQLRLINSVWHVRDLGSTNGTSLNGLALTSEHSVMPDDELGVASHLFTIDYEPGGPDAVLHKHDMDETAEEPPTHRPSLLELAGIDTDEDKPRRSRPSQAPAAVEKSVAAEADFGNDIPAEFQAGPAPLAAADDDDFLKLIEEDVKRAGDKREGGR